MPCRYPPENTLYNTGPIVARPKPTPSPRPLLFITFRCNKNDIKILIMYVHARRIYTPMTENHYILNIFELSYREKKNFKKFFVFHRTGVTRYNNINVPIYYYIEHEHTTAQYEVRYAHCARSGDVFLRVLFAAAAARAIECCSSRVVRGR